MNLKLIGCACAWAIVLAISPARAAVVVTAAESGGDVILSTSPGGSLDLSGLTFFSDSTCNSSVFPSIATFLLGGANEAPCDTYRGSIFGPTDFGSGGITFSTNGSGDIFGLSLGGPPTVIVPDSYVSGDLLSGTLTFTGESLANLGLVSGSYAWSWSSDSITLNVVAPIPIPAAIWLFGSALGLLGWMRRRAS